MTEQSFHCVVRQYGRWPVSVLPRRRVVAICDRGLPTVTPE